MGWEGREDMKAKRRQGERLRDRKGGEDGEVGGPVEGRRREGKRRVGGNLKRRREQELR